MLFLKQSLYVFPCRMKKPRIVITYKAVYILVPKIQIVFMWFTNFVGCKQLWLWFYTNIVNVDTSKSSTTVIRHSIKKYVRDVRRED